jgi:hypothetical protein
MDLLGPTLVLYGLVGGGVALALYLTDSLRPPVERFWRLASAVLFWPFYLPILLARPGSAPSSSEDRLEQTICIVQAELDAALAGLGDEVQPTEDQRQRIDQLADAWRAMARRIRDMDRLLSSWDDTRPERSSNLETRVRQSLASRQQNLERLRQIRQHTEADLLASLASVRELASRLHLIRFTNAPTEQAKKLLTEITTAVDYLSTVSGPEEQTCLIRKAE